MSEERIDLILESGELTATIEALHDAILRRIRWSVSPQFTTWRRLDIRTAQLVINAMISAYTKAMMTYRDSDIAKHEQFEERFIFSTEIFDLLNDFTVAERWEDLPFHEDHEDGCAICMPFIEMP